MSLWQRKPFIAIRVLGRDGQYPCFEIRSRGHLYAANQTIAWAAVFQPPVAEEWELPESPILVPEEVRLLSSIALCEAKPWDHGLPIITLWGSTNADPQQVGDNLMSPKVISELEGIARSIGAGPRVLRYSRSLAGEDNGEYMVPSTVGRVEDAVALLQRIDAEDQLLLAGLARFLEAARLLNAHETEAAATSLFISMSAALDVIRRQLGAATGAESTVPFDAVHNYFRRTFPHGDEVVAYFEARWEERIITVHPANKYGEFWAPPLMVDDVYWLQKTLIGLYRHIILGEIPEE